MSKPVNSLNETNIGGGFVNPGVSTFTSPVVSQTPNHFGSGGYVKQPQIINPIGQPPAEQDVSQIKYKVSPDEVLMGIEYEMKKQVDKNKNLAKEAVIKNLKKDPKYYSKLFMYDMNPDEKTESLMEVWETMKKAKYERRNWNT